MVVAGAALVVVGVAGVLAGGGDGPSPAAEGAPVTPASSTPAVTAPDEDVQAFVDGLAAAIRNGDQAFLLARLHPEVLRRYGDAACGARMATFRDPTLQFAVHAVGAPGPYEWATDGRTTTVAATVTVAVTRTQRGTPSETEIHLTRVGREWRWFTDCGDPAG